MQGQTLQIVFSQGGLTTDLAITAIRAVLRRHNISEAGFRLYGKSVDLESLAGTLKRTRKPSFNLEGAGFGFHLASVAQFNLSFLRIHEPNSTRIGWAEWVIEFSYDQKFVMAWVVDDEYDTWQNAKDPQFYADMGRPIDHLPMKSNGLPSPLERMEVDISNNPGRYVLRDGYIEAIGSNMWFGSQFWLVSGADKDSVLRTPWLNASEISPGVVGVHISDACFTSADGSIGEQQAQLRALLFGAGVPA